MIPNRSLEFVHGDRCFTVELYPSGYARVSDSEHGSTTWLARWDPAVRAFVGVVWCVWPEREELLAEAARAIAGE